MIVSVIEFECRHGVDTTKGDIKNIREEKRIRKTKGIKFWDDSRRGKITSFFLQFILKGFGEWPALTVVFSWRRVKRRPPTEDLWRPDAHFDVGGPGCYVMSRVEWAEEWKYYISYSMTSLELPHYMVTSFQLLYNIITLLELPLGIMTLLELLILQHHIAGTSIVHITSLEHLYNIITLLELLLGNMKSSELLILHHDIIGTITLDPLY